MTTTAKHQILIVGGGTAGITVAARMLRKGYSDVAVIEPSSTHYYQPLWTLVGGGQAKASTTERPESSVMPKGATWIKNAANAFDPDNNTVTCADGATYAYDVLVVCPGHPARLEGHRRTRGRPRPRRRVVELPVRPRAAHLGLHPQHAVGHRGVHRSRPVRSSAPARRRRSRTWHRDYWRKQGVLNDIDVHLVMPGPRLFGIPAIADSLDAVIADYGITLHSSSEVTSVDAASRKVAVTSVGPGGTDTMLPYDVLHAVPRQSAPDWIKSSPLSTGDAVGYVEIDKHTMQHVRYPNVFSLGDAGSSPNSKTGAAIRKQAPVVVDNIDAFLKRQPLRASYDGYSSCPIVTSSHAMLLAEFDYDLNLKPSFPLLDPTKPHRAYWYLKKYGLPFMYWNLMLKGLA